ncbi:MAG TPA: tetratricopeptide repeat protein, partial [Thermoanaerobaculia bacterium]|nr:tetratricopeptide repeat protein [Thermoanaerobaculia bacterium]
AVKRLIEPPPPPSSIVPGIGRRWETVILRCLERDPIQRFDSALALGRALQGEPVETRFRRLHPSVPYPLVLVGLLLLLVTGILWFRNSSLPPTSPESVEPRRAAAVLGFRNLSGESESDWLSNALVEMLSMELSAAGNLRVVPGENVARARVELSLAGMDHLSAGNLARVARNLGVDLVLAGSYLVVGEGTERQIRLDLRLQETATGETLATLTRTGAEEDLLSMVSSAGAGLRAELGTAELTPTEAGSVRAAQPSTVEAARYYAEGVASLRLSDGLTARDLLTRAAVADPRNALVHSELAAAWAALGYDEHARRAARQALDLSAALPRQERLMVEGRYREAAREWDRAIEIYRSLSTLEPDNLEFGLRLVRAEVAAGRAESAIRTLEGLRRLPAPAGADPRIDLAEAAAAEARGDFRAEVDAATRAAEKGKRLEAWLLVAEARLAEWWARRNLGELDLATAASNEARQIAARVGDRGLLARSLNAIATVQRQRGRHREAEALDRESLQVFREIGDQRRESWALNNLARGALELGDLQQALGDFQSSLTIVREIGDRSGVARGLSNSGNVLVELGRISEADRNYRESLAIGTETGDRRAIAWAQYNSSSTVLVARGTEQAERLATDALAEFIRIGEQRGIGWCRIRLSEILLAEGRVRAAEQQAAEALERFMVVGDPRGQHAARFQQGRIAFHAGDLARAKTAHEEALQLRERLDDRWNAAISRMRLAAIALEQDRLPDASALLRAALVVFGEQHAAGREAEAQALLARVHFTGDDIAAAKEASRSATRLIADLEDQRLVAEVGIAVAAIEGASAGSEPAIKRLDDLAAAMRRAGHRDLELQARLHTGILALRSENFAAARSRLVEVRDEAASAGFGLLRDQAAELLAGGPRT